MKKNATRSPLRSQLKKKGLWLQANKNRKYIGGTRAANRETKLWQLAKWQMLLDVEMAPKKANTNKASRLKAIGKP